MSYEHARKLGPAIKVAVSLVFPLFVGIAASGVASAQDIPASMYSEMKWRMIGPFRAGKVNGVAGIPGNPAIYYMGADEGGVWNTTNSGRSLDFATFAPKRAAMSVATPFAVEPNLLALPRCALRDQPSGRPFE